MDELDGTPRSADSGEPEADELRELERELQGIGREPGSRRFPGCELLANASPSEVLRRIFEGDPLALRSRCRDRIVLRAIMMDVERVFPVAVACVAHAAPRYRGDPPLDAWLDRCIDRAIRTESRAGHSHLDCSRRAAEVGGPLVPDGCMHGAGGPYFPQGW